MTTIHRGLEAALGGVGSGSTEKTTAAQIDGAPVQSQVQQGSSSQTGEVAITHTAQLMANLEQQLAGTPDVDQSRVDSIRQALSNGSYQVSPSRIADGLLAAQKFDTQASSGSGSSAQANTVKAFESTAQLGSAHHKG